VTAVRLRLIALALGLGLIILIGHLTGAREWMTEERLQSAVLEAGWWGLVLFFATFTLGQLLQVPGVIFILVARVVWGPAVGFANAYAGSLISAALVFVMVRAVGGKPLGEITWPPAKKILAGLDRRPLLTIAALRAVMMLAPPLTYALALSRVKQRDHLLGSAVGLLVPVSFVVFLSEAALALWRSL
jgi:uncharacterized membrane protein YdjX (TVP38/TMEM64 family)